MVANFVWQNSVLLEDFFSGLEIFVTQELTMAFEHGPPFLQLSHLLILRFDGFLDVCDNLLDQFMNRQIFIPIAKWQASRALSCAVAYCYPTPQI